MAEFCGAQSFLQNYKVHDCETQITDSHVERIAHSYCKRWKLLPPYLKMETIVAEDIDRKQVDECEKRYDFIKIWKQEKGSEATYLSLISALLEIDCKDDAGNVCQLLCDSEDSLATNCEINPALPTCNSSASGPAGNDNNTLQHQLTVQVIIIIISVMKGTEVQTFSMPGSRS